MVDETGNATVDDALHRVLDGDRLDRRTGLAPNTTVNEFDPEQEGGAGTGSPSQTAAGSARSAADDGDD